MKRLLLSVPLLLSTMAIGPCAPISIGNLDGGVAGRGGTKPDGGTGGPRPDAGTGGAAGVGTGGGPTGGTGGLAGAGGGPASGAGGSGAAGAGGTGTGGGMAVLHPQCAGSGWFSESVLYTDQMPVDYHYQIDTNGVLHLAMRSNVTGLNSTAYTRCLSGGGCEFPVSLPAPGAVADPTVGLERSGLAHLAWTGSGVNDNIQYLKMDEDGRWPASPERAVTGSMMSPLELRADNGSPFIVYFGPGIGIRGIAAKSSGGWVTGSLPSGTVVSSALDSNGTAHLLYADASGVTHAVVQSDVSLKTEVVTPMAVTAVKLVIDAAGTLHALYSGAGRVAYASRGSAGWAEELLPQGTAALSLKVDGAGDVHVVVAAPAGGLAHALRSRGTWSIDPVPAPAALGRIVEDNNGMLHQVRGEIVGSNTAHYIHDQICIPTDVIDAAIAGSNQGAWRGRLTPTRPPIRSLGSMVYDSVRREIVQYGGTSAGDFPLGRTPLPTPGTWTLSSAGGGWTSKGGAAHPGARITPGMAFDAGRGRVVLMGGGADANVWEWDGSAWTSRAAVAPAPNLTGSVRLAYDSVRARVVVWASDGIWEWDGTAGTFAVRASSPPAYVGAPTGNAAALFDTATGHIVGLSSGATWDWDPVANVFSNLNVTPAAGVITQIPGVASLAAYDGQWVRVWRRGQAAWTQASTGFGPLRRTGVAVTFDPVRGAVVMFGGADESAPTAQVRIYTDTASPSGTFSRTTPMSGSRPPGRRLNTLRASQGRAPPAIQRRISSISDCETH